MKYSKTIIVIATAFILLLSCKNDNQDEKMMDSYITSFIDNSEQQEAGAEKTVEKSTDSIGIPESSPVLDIIDPFPFNIAKTSYQTLHLHCCPGEEFEIKASFEGTNNGDDTYEFTSLKIKLVNSSDNKKYLKKNGVKIIEKEDLLGMSKLILDIEITENKNESEDEVTAENKIGKFNLAENDYFDPHVLLNNRNFGDSNECESYCNTFKYSFLERFEDKEWLNNDPLLLDWKEINKDEDWKYMMQNERFANLESDLQRWELLKGDWWNVTVCRRRIKTKD